MFRSCHSPPLGQGGTSPRSPCTVVLRFPNQRAGHWLSIDIPASEARAPFVLDDVVDEAHGEAVLVAEVDEGQ